MYTTEYAITASDGQEIHFIYNNGMCARVLVMEYKNDDTEHIAGLDMNEFDLTFAIEQMTAIRDAIREQKAGK